MGVTPTALVDREPSNRLAPEHTQQRQVIRRVETRRDQSHEPLASTLQELRETAPSSRQLERFARAKMRVSLEPKVAEIAKRRTELVVRDAEGRLSPAEHAKLDYLTWQLEQYEEAQFGDHWDLIEASIAQQAALARDMQSFIDELRDVRPSAFRSRK